MTTASNISKKNFAKLLAGDKTYISAAAKKELKAAGLSELLHESHINKSQATKAVKLLQTKGLLSAHRQPGVAWEEAATEQFKENELARKTEILTNTHLVIMDDVVDEAIGGGHLTELERYGRKAAKGRQIVDLVKKERSMRDAKVKAEQKKRADLARPLKPGHVALDLPDMGIDFGR